MNIEVKEIEDYDFIQVEDLLEELFIELGEPKAHARKLAEKFLDQLIDDDSSLVLLVRSFITGELVTLSILTESKVASESKYGVLDEIFTTRKYRSVNNDSDLLEAMKGVVVRKGWKRIDVAAPTDAWHRTVRFRRNQKFRLTSPKFKRVISIQGVN